MGDETTDIVTAIARRYADGADRRDVETFLAAFTPDAVLEVYRPGHQNVANSVYVGHEQLRRIPPALAAYDSTDHVIGAVEIDGRSDDVITARVSCRAHHVRASDSTPDGPADAVLTDAVRTDTVMTITYHDTYRLQERGWLIARREVRMSSVDVVALPITGRDDTGTERTVGG